MPQSLLKSITLVLAPFMMGTKRNQLNINTNGSTEVEAIWSWPEKSMKRPELVWNDAVSPCWRSSELPVVVTWEMALSLVVVLYRIANVQWACLGAPWASPDRVPWLVPSPAWSGLRDSKEGKEGRKVGKEGEWSRDAYFRKFLIVVKKKSIIQIYHLDYFKSKVL